MVNWTDLRPGFCESVVSGPPEYTNSISSIALIFYGLMGIFASKHSSILIRLSSAMLTIAGIGSTIYHWTLYAGWSQLDGFPMLIASYLGAMQAVDSILYKLYRVDTITLDTLKYQFKFRIYEILSGVNALIFSCGLGIAMALSSIDDTEHWFTIAFLIPELIIGVTVLIMRFLTHKHVTPFDSPDIQRAFKYMWYGFGFAIFSGLCWFLTEKFCHEEGNEWLRYTYAHSIWHIGISGGMYYLMQFFVYIYSYNKGSHPYFVRGDTILQKIFYLSVPVINVHLQEKNFESPQKNEVVDSHSIDTMYV
jgi:hypothetical protein